MNNPLRGEIWLVDWSPSRGSEQNGIRPSVIIQNNFGNKNESFRNTIITTISTKGRDIPFHVRLFPNEQNGLKEISYVKTEQIMTISKERLIKKLGKVSINDLFQIETGVKRVLNFN